MVATTSRTPNDVYILDVKEEEKCCMGKIDECWLWHRGMGHINFDKLIKFRKKKPNLWTHNSRKIIINKREIDFFRKIEGEDEVIH